MTGAGRGAFSRVELRRFRPGARTYAAIAWAICLYGALLRFEAFERAYGPLEGSEAFVSAQAGLAELSSRLHPASLQWQRAPMPYRHDAKSYLDAAREMRHFYEARLREPLFVFATKVGLWITGGQDIAVSLASSACGALIVPGTLALGRAIGGPVVGLGAAALVAVEPQMIDSGARGYRDDLFALLTVLFTWNCIRLSRTPTRRVVILTALAAAGACLTRITALTFVIPGLVAAAAIRGRTGLREAGRPAAVAAVLAAVLVAPFLVNCWRAFGDPFYSINWHSAYYSRRSTTGGTDTDAAGFLLKQFERSPLATADSVLRGLTYYPWENKWTELGRHWGTPLAAASKYLALLGLLMWLWWPAGRLSLVTLGASTLPFAFTWETLADWRFTQHAYPFYLVAAMCAVAWPVRWVVAVVAKERPRGRELVRGMVRVAATAAIAAGVAALLVGLPALEFYWELSSGRAASVGGDPRRVFFMEHQAFFFAGGGWSAPRTDGNVTFHDLTGTSGRLRVPMSGAFSYRCLVRLGTRPGPDGTLPEVSLTVNDWSARMVPDGEPTDVGRHWATIPRSAVRTGVNHIAIAVAGTPGGHGSAPRLWFVRFFPES